MARSQHVWVVTAPGMGTPLATFTVKHELVRWLGEHTQYEVDVARFRDGNHIPYEPPVWMDPRSLTPIGSVPGGATTLMGWIARPSGSCQVTEYLYLEAVEGGRMMIRRHGNPHVEMVSRETLRALLTFGNHAELIQALTEMYDDAAIGGE